MKRVTSPSHEALSATHIWTSNHIHQSKLRRTMCEPCKTLFDLQGLVSICIICLELLKVD